MNTWKAPVLVGLVIAAVVQRGSAQPKLLTAQNAWLEVIAATHDAGSSAVAEGEASSRSHGQPKFPSDQKRFQQGAGLAKGFYSKYPNDPNVARAKKLEALAALRAISGDLQNEAQAFQIADAYRKDQTNVANDRFEVAWIEERRKLTDAQRNSRGATSIDELDSLADKLRRECGDVPGVYNVYGELMRNADMESGHRIALKLLGLPAPKYIESAAQAEVDRYALKGKKIDLPLNDSAGRAVALNAGKKSTTVIFIANGTDQLTVSNATSQTGTQWIRVVVDGTSPSSTTSSAGGNIVTTCTTTGGLKANICQMLNVPRVPYVVVLDSSGQVQSYGGVDLLTQLLAGGGK